MTDTRTGLAKTILLSTMMIAAIAGTSGYFFLPAPRPVQAATQGAITYTYDSFGRITGEANPSGNSGTYTYDNAGNRTAATLN